MDGQAGSTFWRCVTWPARGIDNVEDFALDVAGKVKPCGFRRVTVLGSLDGDCWRIFDGEVPTQAPVYAQVEDSKR